MLCIDLSELGLAPLPVLIGILFFGQSFLVYVIAVIKQDVDPVLPYLSSAADHRPQSCIFSIGTNISSVLLAFLVYVRYNQIKGILEQAGHDGIVMTVNYRSKWFGYASAFGMFIVANVQETAIIPVHMTAAVVAFGGFNVFMILQCYVTHRLTPDITLHQVLYYRLVCTGIGCASFLIAIIYGILASHTYHQTYPDLPTPRPWNRHFYQPGYGYHQVSAAAEWICAISQIFFMQSFGPEFEEIFMEYGLRSEYIYRNTYEYDWFFSNNRR
ncbi:unnamed protein product [Caenorhabditis sp. 36 PRJEB53466]|nr:unnamed protein product [Caenorhabditis sp. 36 PRJEB53466]